jgi:hypothetical protein
MNVELTRSRASSSRNSVARKNRVTSSVPPVNRYRNAEVCPATNHIGVTERWR